MMRATSFFNRTSSTWWDRGQIAWCDRVMEDGALIKFKRKTPQVYKVPPTNTCRWKRKQPDWCGRWPPVFEQLFQPRPQFDPRVPPQENPLPANSSHQHWVGGDYSSHHISITQRYPLVGPKGYIHISTWETQRSLIPLLMSRTFASHAILKGSCLKTSMRIPHFSLSTNWDAFMWFCPYFFT